MAAPPLTPQGLLNRVRGSLVFAALPNLNVTASYCGKAGVSCTFDNDAGLLIGTMTGGVTSPEPYQMVTIEAHILKTQALAATYKRQFETLTNVGDFTFIPDASTLPNYQFINGILLGVGAIETSGTNPDFVVRLKAIYNTNSSLFDVG